DYAKQIIGLVKEEGVIMGSNSETVAGYDNILQLSPPLNLTDNDVETIVTALKKAFDQVTKQKQFTGGFKMAEVKTLKNYVNGEWVTPKSNETAPVYNPATGEVIAHVPISSSEDVDNAVELANQAYKEWKEVPVPKRARLMFKL